MGDNFRLIQGIELAACEKMREDSGEGEEMKRQQRMKVT